MRSTLKLRAGAIALLVAGAACTEQVVTAVRVATVQVTPDPGSVEVGSTLQLKAVARDASGNQLSGRAVTWASSGDANARVADGVVTGIMPGHVSITATVEGIKGQAAVDVTGVPLSVDPDSIVFAATAGAADPQPVRVSLASDGGDPGSLSADVAYGPGDPGGWLSVSFSGSAVPVDLIATPSIQGLSPGPYSATVLVSAPAAADTARVHVSLAVKAAQPPASPSAVAAVAVDTGTIDVTWRDNSSDETEFRVERSSAASGAAWAGLATVAANRTSYADSSVAPSTTYWYRVQACSKAGCSGFSAADSATTPAPAQTPPAAPSGLVANAVSSTQVDLSWTDNSATETEFQVERGGGPTGAPWASLVTLPADSTLFSDTTVAPSSQYYYRVRACSAAGCSAFAPADTVTTPAAPPAAPSALTATAISSSEVDLAWQDNSNNETEFRLERSGGSSSTWTEIAIIVADSTTYVDASVAASTTYDYRVRACSASGCSAYSATASATTPAPPPPPAAPSNLSAKAASATQVDLTWQDNSNNETEFRLERSLGTGGSTWTQIASLPADATSYSDGGVVASTTYSYRVRACSAAGCSAYSATDTVTTPAPAPPAIALSTASVTLSTVVGDSTWANSISVTNGGTGSLTGLATSTSYQGTAQGWLRTALAATTAPTTLDLLATATRLLQGTYGATVAVSSPVAANSPQLLAVTLNVAKNPSPWIFIDSTSVSFSGTSGGTAPAMKTANLVNAGTGKLDQLQVSVTYAAGQATGWLAVTLSRTAAPTDIQLYAALVDGSGASLPPGTYNASVVVSSTKAANSPVTLPVTLTVH